MASSFLLSENYTRGLNRVRPWFNSKNFVPEKFRGYLMGMTINSTVGEVCAYKLIQQDINAGHLPMYTADIAIIALAAFEAILAPLISWWGFRNRRAILIRYTILATLISLSWYMMPSTGRRQESEFCDAANASNNTAFVGVPGTTVARLVMIVVSCIIFVLSRVAAWSHGIAYSDEYAPQRTSMHFGILVIARMIALVFGNKILTDVVENAMPVQITILLVGYIAALIQLFLFFPKTAPEVDGVQKMALPLEDRNFFQSIGRVCRNPLAMNQILSMGLLGAAAYGFISNEIDLIKVKYNLLPEKSLTVEYTEVLVCHYLVVAVLLAGMMFSAPIVMDYCKGDAIKQVIKTTMIPLILYLVITFVLKCDHGKVVGLESDNYENPECSISCGCKARMQEFEPVCVVDSMLTYVSPCQAGCGGSRLVNGVMAYTNCTCSSTGRALVGACTDTDCKQSHRLQNMMIIVIVTFTILAFQAQGVLVLRAVDPRDKSVAIGMMWSIIAMMTFICGHLIFFGLRAVNCRWFDAGRCQLQGSNFPYIIGGTSAGLVVLSLIISIASWFFIRAANKRKVDPSMEDTQI